jgi:hypothetical protein
MTMGNDPRNDPQNDPRDVDLGGLIDMHIHTSPDVRPRALDDIQVAREAAAAGLRAVVYKSHVTCTADRASIAQKMVPGVRVLGGVTLNDAVGGLNPAAAEAALSLGARVVWMPTTSARNHIAHVGGEGEGIYLLDEDGRLLSALFELFDLLRQHDAILATGHLSVEEIIPLVRAARSAGVAKVVITHPEVPWVNMSTATQEEMRDAGACFERCFASTLLGFGSVPLARMAADIRQVGLESTVLATDFGASVLPPPVEGMRTYVTGLMEAGFSEEDIRLMGGDIPARLLELE